MDTVIEQEIDGEADDCEDTEAMACSLTADRENTEADPLQSFERELSDLPIELPEKLEKSSQTKVASENEQTQTDHVQCTSAKCERTSRKCKKLNVKARWLQKHNSKLRLQRDR